MSIPFVSEIEQSLRRLGLPLTHDTLMIPYFERPGMRALRNCLMAEERTNGVTHITGGTFWGISPKYRFDARMWDIGSVAGGLALSAALAEIYVYGTVKPRARAYESTWSDELFWYYIDTGLRLASSGWDRLALLLDLAFKLGLGQYCNLRKVLDQLSRPEYVLQEDPHLKILLRFRDNEFSELENRQRGHGLRDEATHLLHVWTRYKLEYLEQHVRRELGSIRGPHEWHSILLHHYHHFIQGMEETVALIDARAS